MSVFHHFKNNPLNNDQKTALSKLENFILGSNKIFILKGYAGTGKTTLIKGLIGFINETGKHVQLMAPTGRAANVIQQKTKHVASTIHSAIYNFNDLVEYKSKDTDGSETFKYYFRLKVTPDNNRNIYIIDEDSMISDVYSEGEFFRFGSGTLLSDLMENTKIQNPTTNAKIIFIGDPGQLPPIGMNISPALSEEYLYEHFNLQADGFELTEITRQQNSQLLNKINEIRNCLSTGYYNHFDLEPDNESIFNLNHNELIPQFMQVAEDNIIITYKNKTANEINKRVRTLKYDVLEYPQPGDRIIVSRNNHKQNLFNGELGIVIQASEKPESMKILIEGNEVALSWRNIELLFKAEDGSDKIIQSKMLDNFINSDDASLSSLEQKALYIAFKIRNPKLKPNTPEFEQTIKHDPYFNCLLIKYAYAITCHKAQGGEWKNVFVVWDYNNKDTYEDFINNPKYENKHSNAFYRWAYTAVTRSKSKLFNFNAPYFNVFSKMSFVSDFVKDEMQKMNGLPDKPCVVEVDEALMQKSKMYEFDGKHRNLLQKFFIVNYLMNERFIKIIDIAHHNYHENYTFRRDDKWASFAFYYKAGFDFSHTNLLKTNDEGFSQEILKAMHDETRVELKYPQPAVSEFEQDFLFHFVPDEEPLKPFLQLLYLKLVDYCTPFNISIANIQRFQYLERYFFTKDKEAVCLNFYYNINGIITSITVHNNNGNDLLLDLYEIINKIKSKQYASY